MSRGYSFDLHERVIGLVEGGMSRRAAARHLMVSASSSIKWHQRFEATGRFAEKPGKKLRPSPLDDHAEWLLALVADEADLTLAEIEVRLLAERQFKTTDSSMSRFFQRHGVRYKKRCTPASHTGKTWPRRARNGKKRRRRLIQTSWFYRCVLQGRARSASTNTQMTRPRGRCAKGQRLVDYTPYGHWNTATGKPRHLWPGCAATPLQHRLVWMAP